MHYLDILSAIRTTIEQIDGSTVTYASAGVSNKTPYQVLVHAIDRHLHYSYILPVYSTQKTRDLATFYRKHTESANTMIQLEFRKDNRSD